MTKRLSLGVLLAGLVLLAAAPVATSAPQTASEFTVVASPHLDKPGYLTHVAAVSASDVWATGVYGSEAPLIEHYNGSKWSIVGTTHLAYMTIGGISVHGAGVVWIAGTCGAPDARVACVAHRVGSQWVRVAVPAQLHFAFRSMLAFSNTNVLVGGNDDQTEMIRWNGHSWSRVNIVHYDGQIIGIAGTLSDRLFAAGTIRRFERELADGSWRSTVPFPAYSGVTAISASSAENVWEVGTGHTYNSDHVYPVAMRWNGKTSTTIGFPSAPANEWASGVVTARPGDTWMVGSQDTADGGQAPLIEHYTGGSSFTDVPAPDPGASANGPTYYQLVSIAAVPGAQSDLWAVGNGNGQPLILHRSSP